MPTFKRHILLLATLWTATLFTYSNSFHGGLIFDSTGLILEDSRIAAVTKANLHRILTEEYWSTSTRSGLYRPLSKLSYLFNYAILGSGAAPESYHWVNFLIHAVNLTLVYLLAFTLWSAPPLRQRNRPPDGGTQFAFLWAALWGLHPVLTESVTNVVGRPDLLAGFAVLAGLLCHIRAQGRHWRWLAALAVVAAIGIFSKESAVVLVAAMALYDVAFRRRNWPSYVVVAVPFAFFAWARAQVIHGASLGAFPFTDNPIVGAGFWPGRFTAIKVIGRYILLLLWPAQLSCDYSYNEIPLARWDDFGAILSLAVIAGIAAAAVYNWRRPVLFFCLGFSFATLLPTSNLLIPIGAMMAERFLYLPAIGAAGCAVDLLGNGKGRWVLAAACMLLAARTYSRNNDWRDERSLWTSALQAAPGSYKVHMSAAGGLPLQAAAAELERALAIIDPLPDAHSVPSVYINAGGLFRDLGDGALPAGRLVWYRKSLATLERGERIQNASGPVRWYQLYEELATTWLRLGDLDRAAVHQFEATLVAPSYTPLKQELADLYRNSNIPCAIENGAVNFNCPAVQTHACAAARALGQPKDICK